MSEANPTAAAKDPPPLVNKESAASDKNNAGKHGTEESREVAMTSSDAGEVKSGYENGTEGAADEDANIVEVDDTNKADSVCSNVVGAVDVKMVGTQNDTEAVDVKIGDTQHGANIEAEDVKMADTQHEANADVKMDDTPHEVNIEAEEDACQVKEGMIGDNQYAKVTEGEDTRMVEAKVDARKYEEQKNRKEEKEGNIEEKKNQANVEDKDVKMIDKEDACQEENKEEKNEDSRDAKVAETDEMKMVEATDTRNTEVQGNRKKEEEKNEDSRDAKVAETDEMKMVEAKIDTRDTEVQGNGKKEEMKAKAEEKENDANIEDNVKTVDKEDACQKEDKEGSIEDSHDAKVAEGDEIKLVQAKTEAGSAEGEENGKREERASKTDEKKNNASIDTKELKLLDKEDACQKEDNRVNNEDTQNAKAKVAEVIEYRKKGEMEGKAEEEKNVTNIESENAIMVDKENACPNEVKVGKNDDSQDAKAAEGEYIKKVEAKSDGGNAEVKESGKKEEKEDQNGEKSNSVSVQVADMKIIDKEDGCRKEGQERKTENSHSVKAAEGEELTMLEAKSMAVHAEVKENGKKEDDESKTEEKQNDNKAESICMERQDKDKMELAEVDKQGMNDREQIGVEKKDGLKEEDKRCVNKHEVSEKNRNVEESQEELQGEAKGNVEKQEVYDREQNIEEKQEGLKEEERIDSSKHEVAKDDQNRAVKKQEGDEQDGKILAEKKEEEKQDVKLTAEEKGKISDGKVAAEKEEGEEVNKSVAFENNEEVVIEMGVSEMDEEMETNGKITSNKQEGKEDDQMDDICKQEGQKKGTKRSNVDMEEPENGSASKKELDGKAAVEQVGESGKSMEESKNEASKSKKARIVREKDHENDKKQDDFKSRETKELLNTPSPYSLDRPARERKTVKRMVEEIDKGPGGSFVVEKGRGIPLKNIPGVTYRISRKKPAELKFLHQILFGRFGKAVDFKSHILEFSGFVWHESDEKHRTKAKEKLDKCSKGTLLDLCYLLAVPVPRAIDSRKEDIIVKLLDFIAEPHAKDDSTLSDDQGSNSRKRKRERGSATKNPAGTSKRSKKKHDDELTSHKKKQKYSESESDEEDAEEKHEDDHIKSDSEEEDRYGPRKSLEGKCSTVKRKSITGSFPKTAPVATLSKCSSRVLSSSRGSKDKHSAEDSNVFSRKSKPITPKHTINSEKEISEGRSSGKGLTTSRGKSAQAEAEKAPPSKDELQKTIYRILQKVDLNKVTFSDILTMLGEHYKMDFSSRKETIKSMIVDELTKIAEADED